MNGEQDNIAMDPMLRPLLELYSQHRGWYIALGTLLVLAGCMAIASPMISTLTTVYMLGWLLIVSGAAQLLGAAASRRWGGFFLTLLSGALSLVIGIMALRHPGSMDLALTMLIATFLLIGGTFRVLISSLTRFHGWVWSIAGGLVSVLLGAYIYATLPASSFWVLGTFIGVDLLSTGWTWIFLASALPAPRNRDAGKHRPPTVSAQVQASF
jgi:uncharacterized membrane protein HdeD (DUF308 family)